MQEPRARIASLDALRGVGVLGILLVHVQSFGGVAAARVNPALSADLHGVDRAVWLATAVLADGKFISIFAMLFGAGLLLFAESRRDARPSAEAVHDRRMVVLFLLGLSHAYLLWYGDMLVTFALCGTLVFPYRAVSPPRLIAGGILALVVGCAVTLGLGLSLPWWPSEARAHLDWAWSPAPETMAREIAAYRGGWLEQMAYRAPAALHLQTAQFALRSVWQVGGLMLIGMGLFKLGVLSGTPRRRFYAAMMGLGFGVGTPMAWWGVERGAGHGWDLVAFTLVDSQLIYWANFLVGLGWIGLVMSLCRAGWRLGPLAAVGRTALSNYLFQTLVCTTIFYGHGLGLFARVDRSGQVLIVLGVWALQLVLSSWWIRHFSAGPVEWLWRRLVVGRPVIESPCRSFHALPAVSDRESREPPLLR